MNHAPKQFYQTWKADHPPLLAFERRGDQPLAAWSAALREAVRACLGDQPASCPPDPQRLEAVDVGDHIREKWVIQTEAGFWMPFYLLLPKDAEGPRAAVLAVHGHGPGKLRAAGIATTDEEAEHQRTDHEDYGLQAVRAGYVALCPDLRGFGECIDDDHAHVRYGSSCHYSAGRAAMVGRSLVGERGWDLSRAVDFLVAHPLVDADRIACVGHSGGGTATLFTTALEPRIRVAVINAYLCDWSQSLYGVPHCPCNFVPGMLRWAECGDVGALIAPRPLLVNTGARDPIFPLAGVESAFATVRAAYEAQGAGERVELFIGPDAHRFYPERTWDFLAQWL